MNQTEYEAQWNEGEEPGVLVDAVAKAKAKQAHDGAAADDEFAKAYEEHADVTPAVPVKAAKTDKDTE